ncbi:leucine-rich repeats and immunoglobulin-like domains protein 2 isoform X1 [Haliotis rubra]|uniref:leucine-rich repeats and immunoglobulin-like domains protein 2 isoform X1 n=1 Tax=Haliotis rubra TaxID=36100 RepID=UPI001EE50F89|nr:leucine-rich repeats and immunoglobulin-like domains protein 2 isoform X1 [Haliotis rubra]
MAAMPRLFVSVAFVVLGSYIVQHGAFGENVLCPGACSCLARMVDCSKKGLIEVPKDLPSWVTILDLQSNAITTLNPDDFKGLRLIELDLSNNDIKFINNTVLHNLSSLQILKLNYNKLTEVPVMSANSSLTELALNHNAVNTLNPEAFQSMPNLKTLELNYNEIMDLPLGTFPAKSKLEKLFLNNNRIVSLELGSFVNITSLEWLKLNKNKLMEIQKHQFVNLTNLKTLELTRNRIHKVEGLAFAELKHLKVLKLKKNALTNLMDGAFYGLERVETLLLDHNNISSVQKRWLYGLESIRQLTLSHNNIHTIEQECWGFCKKLTKLDMTHNRLSSIASRTFAQLEALQELLLNFNLISRIDDGSFKDLSSLTTLELNNNEIADAIEDSNSAFDGLRKLVKLSLATNKILSITREAFDGLDKLRHLYMEDNAITSIEENPFVGLNMRDLHFNTSNLLCDCQIAWLPAWLRQAGFESSVHAVCSHPISLKGRNIFDVQFEDFKCINLSKPLILEDPKSQIALKGDNVTLGCIVKVPGEGTPKFQWKKDNILLTSADVVTEGVQDGDAMSYTSRLHMRNVQDDMNGLYQCVITNNFGSSYSKKAEISVHVFPVFTKIPVDVTVKVGTTAKLECSATGQPQPTIAWQKDGGINFPAARDRRMHVMPSDDTFFITNTRTEDEGIYSCTATNDAGTIIINATLTVLETPSFSQPMDEEKVFQVRDTVVLECRASGKPKPKLKWLKDDKELVFTDRHFTTADDQLLIIVDTQPSDKGTYTCKMSNTLGEQKGKTLLKLRAGDGSFGNHAAAGFGLDDESTTTGIIIIAVVCCVVGTSLVWVIIIYQTRKRHELYSSTPTGHLCIQDETTLPCEVPSSGYTSSDKEGSFSQPPITVLNYQYPDYQMKESGYESSSGRFRPNGWNRPAAIFPSDVDEDDQPQSIQYSLADQQQGRHSGGNSISSLHYPHSETDTIASSHSTSSTHTSGHHTLRTFHPQLTNHDRCQHLGNCDNCESCECCENSRTVGVHSHVVSMHKSHSISSIPSSRSSGSVGRPDGVLSPHVAHSKCSSVGTPLANHSDSGVCECASGGVAGGGLTSPQPVHITCNPLDRLPTSVDSTREKSHKVPNGACPRVSAKSQHATVNTQVCHPSANHVPAKTRDCYDSPHSVIPGPHLHTNSVNRTRQNSQVDV